MEYIWRFLDTVLHSSGICPLSLMPACGIWNSALREAQPQHPPTVRVPDSYQVGTTRWAVM